MHDHGHHHHHHHAPQNLNRAFVLAILLNLVYVIVELSAGFKFDSLALLSDASHNISDIASLLISALAFWLLKRKAPQNLTYGYRKTTVLATLINAILLLIAVGGIIIEAIERFENPPQIKGLTVAIVAGVGIVINSLSAFLFHKDQEHDANVKGAYLHLLADAMVSVGVVFSGILIKYTNWYWLDPVISLVIALVIVFSTWNLLKDSVLMSLDAVPNGIDLNVIKEKILNFSGIEGIHHIHVWGLSTTENALTAHLVVSQDSDLKKIEKMSHDIKHMLEHLNIHHATLEFESKNGHCHHKDCE